MAWVKHPYHRVRSFDVILFSFASEYSVTAPHSLYFYDYESWGADPKRDRPAQFGGLRTDLDLNPLAEDEMFYCQLAPDYLPHPQAVLITGITPQRCAEKGVPEVEFMRRILAQFSQPNTCVVGYNNIRFDDEMTRYSLYRNFFEPYSREWQHGCSRWDLLDVVRACYALRPEGIEWPTHADGKPSFRLEDLTKANGIQHQMAHDARADVYATIAVAKLLKTAQPRLYDFLFQHRQKAALLPMVDVAGLTPLVHVSGRFSAWQGCCSWIVPLAFHPTNKNAVICFDLQQDPRPLAALDIETLAARLFTKTADLAEDEQRLGLKLVHLNKCPVLAPAKTLNAERAAALGIDRAACLANLDWLRQQRQVQQKVVALYQHLHEQQQSQQPADKNVDYQLYDGFFQPADVEKMRQLHQLTPAELQLEPPLFQDDRLNHLVFRFRARNYPDSLTHDEQKRWQRYCQDSLLHGVPRPVRTADEFALLLEQALEQVGEDSKKVGLLKALYQYVSGR